MPAYGREIYRFIEARHPEYPAYWNPEPLRKLPDGFFGDPMQFALQIQKQLDQEAFFSTIYFYYIIQLLLVSIDHIRLESPSAKPEDGMIQGSAKLAQAIFSANCISLVIRICISIKREKLYNACL
jgi:hypothetical protein